MVTTVHRDIDDSHLDYMRRHAYAGGIDFSHYFNDRRYRLDANLFGSHLRGSEEAIYDAQTSSARYFQRPDNDYVTLDPNRKTLSGHSGSIRFRRTSKSKFVFETGSAWRSPGFEINDLGYMRNADAINQFTWAAYQLRDPFSIFRELYINTNQWLNWDFGGNFLWGAANANFNTTFRNNYTLGGGITRVGEQLSNTALRGGPSSKWPGDMEYNMWAYSDSRKKIRIGLGGYAELGFEDYSDYREGWLDVTIRPTNALRVSLNPALSRNRPEMQYIATESLGDEARYLFGRLDQKTTSVTFRLDYCITPNLTVQYYGSPFISAGRYTEFKRIINPKAAEYRERFHTFDGGQIAYDTAEGIYSIDEDGDGAADYGIGNPDFNFRDFNSNLVVRWEYMPGSLLYLVWSQARSESLPMGSFAFERDMRGLFDMHPHDVFLIKFIKWFSL